MAQKNSAQWLILQDYFYEYLKGDEKITGILFSELAKILKSFFMVRTYSNETSEELVQVALLKIHFARERFDKEMSLKTWVFTIAGRCLIDHWRGQPKEQFVVVDDEEGEQVATQDLDLGSRFELNHDLSQALNLLKPNDRMIVYLCAVEGFSMAEVAETMSLSEAAVKIRAHRAYAKIRDLLSSALLILIFVKELL